MKETSIKWTEERNKVKNKVIEHLSICYNLTGKDWEICLETIDSVFFFEDELEENAPNQSQENLPATSNGFLTSASPTDTGSSVSKCRSPVPDNIHTEIKKEIEEDYAIKNRKVTK